MIAMCSVSSQPAWAPVGETLSLKPQTKTRSEQPKGTGDMDTPQRVLWLVTSLEPAHTVLLFYLSWDRQWS